MLTKFFVRVRLLDYNNQAIVSEKSRKYKNFKFHINQQNFDLNSEVIVLQFYFNLTSNLNLQLEKNS